MNLIDRTRTYFRASKEELMAVTWPSRQDIIRYTGLVVATVIVFGVFFSALDFVINAGIQGIVSKKANTTQNGATTSTTPAATPVNVNPVDVQATAPDGTPTDVKVEQVPVNQATSSSQN